MSVDFTIRFLEMHNVLMLGRGIIRGMLVVSLRVQTLDLGTLGVGGPVCHQRELDAARLQRVDRIMRARENEDRFLATGGEAVGEARGEIVGEGTMAFSLKFLLRMT
jgi:hypothetical protein